MSHTTQHMYCAECNVCKDYSPPVPSCTTDHGKRVNELACKAGWAVIRGVTHICPTCVADIKHATEEPVK